MSRNYARTTLELLWEKVFVRSSSIEVTKGVSGVSKIEIWNLLEINLKTDILSSLATQLDTFKATQNKEEA